MSTTKNTSANKIAVVTGGTRGIGKAISLSLARQGMKVLSLYARDRKAADALDAQAKQEKLDIHCIRGDLTNEDQFKTALEAIRAAATQIDIVVHAAASGVHKGGMELTERHMKWTFEINFFAIHKLLRELVASIPSGGRVIGITSGGGTRVIPYYSAVGSSKGAMESLFRHLAFELAPKGIAVNCVCPGLILTDAVEAFPDKENRIEKAVGNTPTGRLTTPEEVADLVLFLCRPEASQIIGQTLVIDGGKTLLS